MLSINNKKEVIIVAIIPNFFLNAVVAIGIDIVGGEKQWIGTGFIVERITVSYLHIT